MYNGECYPNGSYFRDVALNVPPTEQYLHCSLPNSTLSTGQWIRPDGNDEDCNSGGLRCNITNSPATLSLYRTGSVAFGLYTCCLPTSCSDQSSSNITVNIFGKLHISLYTLSCYCKLGWTEITQFRFELLSDMTVVPQQYTLHCVNTGDRSYTYTLYYGSQQISQAHYVNLQQLSQTNCGNCRETLYSSNYTYDNNVTITWDTVNISSGSFSQSVNGDQMYRCNVVEYIANRDRDITVKGIKSN